MPAFKLNSNRFRLHLALLFAAGSAIYFTRLGNPLGGGHSDEPVYIGIAAEMLRTHQWFVPMLGGQAAFYKPPLLYWLIILSYKIFGGPSLFAARFPSAFCAVLCAILAALLGERLINPKAGLLAGWITLTTIPGFYAFGRASLMDVPMTLCITAALYCAVRAAGEKSQFWLGGSMCMLGAASLWKGPVGALICVPALIWILAKNRMFSELRKSGAVCGILAGLSLVLMWPVGAMASGYGKPWFDFFVLQENLGKFTHHLDPSTQYVPGSVIWIHLLSQFLPWSFFLIAAVVAYAFNKEERTTWSSFSLLWIFTVVFIFLLPAKKLSHYTLPAIPPSALLAAGIAFSDIRGLFAEVARELTGIVVAAAGILLFMLARLTGDGRDVMTVAAGAACFICAAFFLFWKKPLPAAFGIGGFLFFYALGLPHLMAPVSLDALQSAIGSRPVYSHDLGMEVLGKALDKNIQSVGDLRTIRQSHGVLILPQNDEIELFRSGVRASKPLLSWNGWKDHIRLLDILQAVVTGNANLIREKIALVEF